jgi:hypothetical protein
MVAEVHGKPTSSSGCSLWPCCSGYSSILSRTLRVELKRECDLCHGAVDLQVLRSIWNLMWREQQEMEISMCCDGCTNREVAQRSALQPLGTPPSVGAILVLGMAA